MIHELPLERRTLHGHFSRDLDPVLTVESGDSVRFSTLDSGWGVEPPTDDRGDRARFEPRDPELDGGHALVGPIGVAGARTGQVLALTIDEIRVGSYGITDAGGWSNPLNERLEVAGGEVHTRVWQLDPDRGTARDQYEREVTLRPFLGVIGLPPPEPGIHSTLPPRTWGGNIDCSELVAGTTLLLPISTDGALLSLGDGHGRQGDGEVAQLAMECPFERAQVTVTVRDDLELAAPIARVDGAWLTFGFDQDLDEAATQAVDGMLALMSRELGLERRDALALASLVVDLRVTQVVNGVKGVHALLGDDAIRFS